MRMISIDASHAFDNFLPFKRDNTEVREHPEGVELYLFGNKIAEKTFAKGRVNFSLAGYNTQTTRERLKALDIEVVQRSKEPFFRDSDGWLFSINSTDILHVELGVLKNLTRWELN